MARPVVLVATTNPAMAYALQERLKEPCRKLGLRLDICPEGDKDTDLNVGVYQSAEELFDVLEKREPMELADTLVILDAGARLAEAFEPKASDDDGWHRTANRPGVAVELLLRFPQVFPVFVSPAVPISDQVTGENNSADVVQPEWLEGGTSWNSLRQEVCTKHKPAKPNLDFCKSLYAFQVPLHFVSPLDGGRGLKSTIARFARGMRCWFDPTGLRTLVRNRFLGTVFNNLHNWDQSKGQRDVLLARLNNVCVAIDEEREFALLNAYTAWKFGRRSWIVTSFGEFDDSPLWVDTGDVDKDVIVLRDIDVRFPDMPESSDLGLPTESKPRELLKNIYSCLWNKKENRDCKRGSENDSYIFPGNKSGSNWLVRAASSESSVKSDRKRWQNKPGWQIGQRNEHKNREYLGLKKPIGTIYELKDWLLDVQPPKERGEKSIAARLMVVDSDGYEGGHGAPYTNLAMAEALLVSSARCKDHPTTHFVGAFLAMEAYELLLGMSKTTALEALLAFHKHEVAAEVNFPGVSHSLDINDRKEDIEQTLEKLYAHEGNDKARVKRMFLSQFWAELRIQYKDGEQFDAAEEANVQSLLNMSWKPKWGRWLPGFLLPQFVKRWILRTATSPGSWLLSAFSTSLFFTSIYAWWNGLSLEFNSDGLWHFLKIFSRTVLVTEQMQFNEGDEIIKFVMFPDATHEWWQHLLAITHLGLSYILFGLLIAMIYRKITRA